VSRRAPLPHLGRNLRRLRLEQGLSQIELAQKAGVSKDTLSKLENEQRRVWPRTLHRLSQALGVQVPELLKPAEQEVIDLSNEGYAGAQTAVAQATPEQRQQLVEREREEALDAISQWLRERTETMWWFLEASVGRYAAVYRTAYGDSL
jgi:transcriptional regulator with XRE-family HTH domain